MKIILVRHPPPDIAPGLCYGKLDVKLRADAAETAQRMAMALAAHRPARVRSSPARRCRAVADTVSAEAAVPLEVDPRLLELDFGQWEGTAWDDVPRALLDAWALDPMGFAPPGGETGAALVARVRAFHGALVGAGEDCVVVSHGGPLKVLAALLRGEAPDLLAPAPAIGSIAVFKV